MATLPKSFPKTRSATAGRLRSPCAAQRAMQRTFALCAPCRRKTYSSTARRSTIPAWSASRIRKARGHLLERDRRGLPGGVSLGVVHGAEGRGHDVRATSWRRCARKSGSCSTSGAAWSCRKRNCSAPSGWSGWRKGRIWSRRRPDQVIHLETRADGAVAMVK